MSVILHVKSFGYIARWPPAAVCVRARDRVPHVWNAGPTVKRAIMSAPGGRQAQNGQNVRGPERFQGDLDRVTR